MPVDSRSRVEDILHVTLGNLDPSALQPPQSRVEALLQDLYREIEDFDGKIPIHICTYDEYNHETGMPTIEDPDENTFYLVPANELGDDMYVEWIFTEGNRWERFGSGGGTVTIEQSDWNQNDSTQADFIKNKPDLTLKLDKNQGAANSGKFMGVNSSGNVVPLEVEGGNIAVTEELVSGEDYELTVEEGETGSVISVAGKTGTVTLDGNDVVFNDAVTYNDGTIGGTVADLKSALDSISTSVYNKWEKGSRDASSSAKTENNARIRNDFVFGKSTGVEKVIADNGYSFLVLAWDLSGTWIGSYHSNGTFAPNSSGIVFISSFDCNSYPNYVFTLVVKDSSGSSNITAGDGNNIHFQYYDETLTKRYKAPDSKYVGDCLTEINTKISNISNEVYKTIASDLDTDATQGKYISPTGKVAILETFNYSDEIEVPVGATIVATVAGGNNASTSVIAIAGTPATNVVTSIDNSVREYSYTNNAEYPIHVVVTYNNTKSHSAYVVYSRIEKLEEEVEDAITFNIKVDIDLITGSQAGKYISTSGSIETLSSFNISKRIKLGPMETVVACVAGSITGATSAIAMSNNNGYINLVSAIDNTVREYTYKNTTGSTIDVFITYNNTKSYACYVNYFVEDKLENLQKEIDEVSEPFADFSMFETFGVIGDSYASGEIYESGVAHDYFNISWGQILARMCGNVCTNFSVGGLTTKTWLTNANGLTKMQSESAKQIYICALGLNDYRIDDYLGTIEDLTDPNADTFYGNYAKIINAIKAKAPNAKIIMSTMANDSTITKAAFNEAIIDIAEYFEIPYIDQRQNNFFQSQFYYNGLYSAHPIAVVYSGMAKAIKGMIEETMVDNYEYFDDYNGQ